MSTSVDTYKSNLMKDKKVRPSLNDGDDDAKYMPVACLNTFTSDWTIKVMV